MKQLLCVRHAESVWNASGRWQGHADPPLSEQGRADAASAARGLSDSIDAIVSSDLARASQTAEIIGGVLGIDVEIDTDLREIDVGAWSGMTNAEIEERWPGSIEGWRAGTFAPPGSEDPRAFLDRVVRGLERIAARDHGRPLVVTHGGVIGRLERHLGVHPGLPLPRLCGRWLGIEADRSPRSNGSLTHRGLLRAIGERVDLLGT